MNPRKRREMRRQARGLNEPVEMPIPEPVIVEEKEKPKAEVKFVPSVEIRKSSEDAEVELLEKTELEDLVMPEDVEAKAKKSKSKKKADK